MKISYRKIYVKCPDNDYLTGSELFQAYHPELWMTKREHDMLGNLEAQLDHLFMVHDLHDLMSDDD